MGAEKALRVALLSDTHGLMRAQARAFAIGCDYIIHGGDIGSAEILNELAALAPLIAVSLDNYFPGHYWPLALYIILISLVSMACVAGLAETSRKDISAPD